MGNITTLYCLSCIVTKQLNMYMHIVISLSTKTTASTRHQAIHSLPLMYSQHGGIKLTLMAVQPWLLLALSVFSAVGCLAVSGIFLRGHRHRTAGYFSPPSYLQSSSVQRLDQTEVHRDSSFLLSLVFVPYMPLNY